MAPLYDLISYLLVSKSFSFLSHVELWYTTCVPVSVSVVHV